MKQLFIILIFGLNFSSSYGQTKMFVEEIAFYHLDSLTKIRSDIKELNYFCNGDLETNKISVEDTFCISRLTDTWTYLRPRQTNIVIIEDTLYKAFAVPKQFRKHGGRYPLSVYRHLKIDNKYFVHFNLNMGMSGYSIIMTLDPLGNLLRCCVSDYVY